MSPRVICISRTTGAGGEAVGRAVSERLGFRYVDEEIITHAARELQLDPRMVARLEDRRSISDRLMDAIAGYSAEDVSYTATTGEPRRTEVSPETLDDDLKALIRQAIADIAADGSAVVVAHAASYALAGSEGVLRVLITASAETRARRLSIDGKLMEQEDAAREIAGSDEARSRYLHDLYGVSSEEPTHYDLVINTDHLKPALAAACVLAVAQG